MSIRKICRECGKKYEVADMRPLTDDPAEVWLKAHPDKYENWICRPDFTPCYINSKISPKDSGGEK